MGLMDFINVLAAGFVTAAQDTPAMIIKSHQMNGEMKKMISAGKNMNVFASEGMTPQADYFCAKANEHREKLVQLRDEWNALGGCIGMPPLKVERVPYTPFELPRR